MITAYPEALLAIIAAYPEALLTSFDLEDYFHVENHRYIDVSQCQARKVLIGLNLCQAEHCQLSNHVQNPEPS